MSECIYEHCERPRASELRAPLCSHHARKVYLEVKDLIDGASVAQRVASARESKVSKRPHYTGERGSVYFARLGELIKIGFSTDVPQRMRSLGADLLCTLPGTREDEKAMHARFGHAWERGEYFRPEADLMAFIAAETSR